METDGVPWWCSRQNFAPQTSPGCGVGRPKAGETRPEGGADETDFWNARTDTPVDDVGKFRWGGGNIARFRAIVNFSRDPY